MQVDSMPTRTADTVTSASGGPFRFADRQKSLSDLPPEILIYVIKIAISSSILAGETLCGVSRLIRSIARPYVWSSVIVRPRPGQPRSARYISGGTGEGGGGRVILEATDDLGLVRYTTVDGSIYTTTLTHASLMEYVPGVDASANIDLLQSLFLAMDVMSPSDRNIAAALMSAPRLRRLAIQYRLLIPNVLALPNPSPSFARGLVLRSGVGIQSSSSTEGDKILLKELWLVDHTFVPETLGDLPFFRTLTHLCVGSLQWMIKPAPPRMSEEHMRNPVKEARNVLNTFPSLTHFALHLPAFESRANLLAIYYRRFIAALLAGTQDGSPKSDTTTHKVEKIVLLVDGRLNPTRRISVEEFLGDEAPPTDCLLAFDLSIDTSLTRYHMPYRDHWQIWETLSRQGQTVWDAADIRFA